jgi:hypothetical protein
MRIRTIIAVFAVFAVGCDAQKNVATEVTPEVFCSSTFSISELQGLMKSDYQIDKIYAGFYEANLQGVASGQWGCTYQGKSTNFPDNRGTFATLTINKIPAGTADKVWAVTSKRYSQFPTTNVSGVGQRANWALSSTQKGLPLLGWLTVQTEKYVISVSVNMVAYLTQETAKQIFLTVSSRLP